VKNAPRAPNAHKVIALSVTDRRVLQATVLLLTDPRARKVTDRKVTDHHAQRVTVRLVTDRHAHKAIDPLATDHHAQRVTARLVTDPRVQQVIVLLTVIDPKVTAHMVQAHRVAMAAAQRA
jgi:hypothetical protein